MRYTDWVQDAAREELRRRAREREKTEHLRWGGVTGWRRRVSESVDAGQAWLVVTIIGLDHQHDGVIS